MTSKEDSEMNLFQLLKSYSLKTHDSTWGRLRSGLRLCPNSLCHIQTRKYGGQSVKKLLNLG